MTEKSSQEEFSRVSHSSVVECPTGILEDPGFGPRWGLRKTSVVGVNGTSALLCSRSISISCVFFLRIDKNRDRG